MDQPLFIEKQYMGRNRYWFSLRAVMAGFCFLVYSLEKPETNSELLLIVGIAITVISVLLLFVIHFKTSVYRDAVVLDGFWSTRKVKISLDNIQKVEKTPYSKFMLNNPVYNLHSKGSIHFYTRGTEAVTLTDKDNLQYVIGSQQAEQLYQVIYKQLSLQNF